MIKDVIESITAAARKLFTNWGALLISLLLYAAFMAVLYFFFATREATQFQVLLSLIILPVAAITLFFTLQAMGLSYVRVGVGPLYLLKRAARDCWKIIAMTLMLVAISLAIYSILAGLEPLVLEAVAKDAGDAGVATGPHRWVLITFDVIRWVLFLFALPLITLHLWISTIREGLKGAFKGARRSIARAFAPRSVLTYLLTCLIFGAISYFLLFKRITFNNEWTELWVVGIKTVFALLSVFIGWFLVIGSLAEMTARRAISESETYSSSPVVETNRVL